MGGLTLTVPDAEVPSGVVEPSLRETLVASFTDQRSMNPPPLAVSDLRSQVGPPVGGGGGESFFSGETVIAMEQGSPSPVAKIL